jgi:hypothetical protein
LPKQEGGDKIMSKKDKLKSTDPTKSSSETQVISSSDVGAMPASMIPEATTPAPPVYTPTDEQKSALSKAISENDYKTVQKISKEIAAKQSESDKAKNDAKKKEDEQKKAALAGATEGMKNRIIALVDAASNPELSTYIPGMEKADVVVFKWDLKDPQNTIECRLFKGSTTPKVSTGEHKGGGGAVKKYNIPSEELLKKYGTNIYDEESSETFQQAWDKTTDGNKRYQIRVKLLKLEGLIK